MQAKIHVAATALLIGVATSSAAQPYPSRPLRLVVPFTAGGGTDITARIVGQHLGERLQARIVIDNRPGAGGIVGTDIVAKSRPDGYSLVMVSASHSVNPTLYAKLPYDTINDFASVSLVVLAPGVLVVNPGVPARTVAELIKLAKAKPGQMVYASAGNGTPAHFGMELFKNIAGINLVHVPYKGSGALLNDIMGGQVAASMPSISSVIALINSGKLRPLAVTSRARSTAAPEVPTMIEAGVPDYESTSWYAVLAPAGTPGAIVDKLSREIADVVRVEEVRARLIEQGLDPVGSSPRELSSRIRDELAKWTRLVKTSGIKVD